MEETPEEEFNELNPTVFVIYEGHKTEHGYFECFQKYHGESKFTFERIPKISFDTHNTVKGDLVELMKGHRTFAATRELTAFYFCTLVLRKYSKMIGLDADLVDNWTKKQTIMKKVRDIAMDRGISSLCIVFDVNQFLDLIVDVASDVNHALDRVVFQQKMMDNKNWGKNPESILKKSMRIYSDVYDKTEQKATDRVNSKRCKRLSKIRMKAISEAEDAGYLNEDIVKEDSKFKMLDLVINEIANDKEYNNSFERDLRNQDKWDVEAISPVENDRTFIVFDRDYDIGTTDTTRTDEYYLGVISDCDRLHYEALLSTPDFEFWLMLHHRDMRNCGIEYTDRKALLRMLCETENISEDKIKIIDEPRYIKYYKDSFEEAINNSKLLETEPTNLLRNNGTNVGLKLKSLLE